MFAASSAASLQSESALRSNVEARPAYAVASSGTREIAPPSAVIEKLAPAGASATSSTTSSSASGRMPLA
jgi:hypothetical protein